MSLTLSSLTWLVFRNLRFFKCFAFEFRVMVVVVVGTGVVVGGKGERITLERGETKFKSLGVISCVGVSIMGDTAFCCARNDSGFG